MTETTDALNDAVAATREAQHVPRGDVLRWLEIPDWQRREMALAMWPVIAAAERKRLSELPGGAVAAATEAVAAEVMYRLDALPASEIVRIAVAAAAPVIVAATDATRPLMTSPEDHPMTETTATAEWHCEAYGPDLAEHGALCFVSAELGKRVCGDQDECGRVMAAERRRVFRRISERAACGDDTAAFLEGEFSSPEQILGGGQEPGEGSPS